MLFEYSDQTFFYYIYYIGKIPVPGSRKDDNTLSIGYTMYLASRDFVLTRNFTETLTYDLFLRGCRLSGTTK